MKKCFLVDGTALIYKGYYAFIKNPLLNSKGENVSALFGFVSSIQKMIKRYKPDYFSIVFDAPGKNFRHEMYEHYKANRLPMPPELSMQIPMVKDFVECAGFSVFSIGGVEADDVLGTLAVKIANKDLLSVIVSGDKDFIQLMTDNIKILNPKSISISAADNYYDDDFVRKKYGIHPTQMKDYLALVGDSSDNVPGVDGIGAKTAEKLLNQFRSIDDIYQNIDKIKMNSPRNKLKAGRDTADLSLELVDIRTNIELDFSVDDMKLEKIRFAEIDSWLLDKQLNSLRSSYQQLSRDILPAENLTREHATETNMIVPENCEKIAVLKVSKTELKDLLLNSSEQQDTGCALTGKNMYFALKDSVYEIEAEEGVSVIENLDDREGRIIIYMFNLKDLYKIFVRRGSHPRVDFYDVGLMYFLSDSSQRNPDSFKVSSLKNLKLCSDNFSVQAAFDAYVAASVAGDLLRKLKDNELLSLFQTIDMPLIRVLARMEENGVYVDKTYLEKVNLQFQTEADDLSLSIQSQAGVDFNLNSPKQLGEVLFEKLKIQEEFSKKKLKMTKTGYSTSSDTLNKYNQHPLINKILRYRSLNKLITTYTDVLPKMINDHTGRIHCVYNQMVTVTGRLSSEKPNLQNIPIRQPEGALIREAFTCEKDKIIISADYSQIELRIMAHLSCDEVMLNAFNNDADIHSETAAKIFSLDPSQVTEEIRSRAKAVNFGVIYGMGARKLSQDTGIDIPQAKEFIESYFSIHSGVREYINETINQAREKGFVRNIFGRIRYLPDINSSRNDKRVLAEHMAVNSPIQGSAADLLKKAMIVIDDLFKAKNMKSRLIMQIHDELVFEVIKEERSEAQEIIKSSMENIVLLNVPLKVSLGKGKNWKDAH